MAATAGLREKLKRYQYKDLIERDCAVLFQDFTHLNPSMGTFTYPNGPTVQLLSLKGTIPMTYKGNVYNIPICIWIPEKHPYCAPYVFVEPTPSMRIKEGRHVDKKGRVYLPYLHDWKHPSSDLYGLGLVLCATFGEEPPVYSVNNPSSSYQGYPSQGGSASSTPYGNYGGQNHGMGMPHNAQGMSMPMPFGGSNRPVYPTSTMSGGMPTPYPGVSQAHSSYPGSSQPPYPAGPGSSQPPYPVGSGASQPPYPIGSSSQPPYPNVSSSYNQTTSSSYSGVTQGYPPHSGSSSTSYPASSKQSTNGRQDSLEDHTIRVSLLSAVEEKLSRRVKEVYELARNEIDSMAVMKSELQNGSSTLSNLQQKIKDETTTVGNSNQILEQKNQEMRDMIAKLESETENLNIDEAIVTTAPLYNQIFELFAEENAVEDAIYFLGEALRREVLELDAFLKAVRKLSRKMFMLRAQLQKARQTAGLP